MACTEPYYVFNILPKEEPKVCPVCSDINHLKNQFLRRIAVNPFKKQDPDPLKNCIEAEDLVTYYCNTDSEEEHKNKEKHFGNCQKCRSDYIRLQSQIYNLHHYQLFR